MRREAALPTLSCQAEERVLLLLTSPTVILTSIPAAPSLLTLFLVGGSSSLDTSTTSASTRSLPTGLPLHSSKFSFSLISVILFLSTFESLLAFQFTSRFSAQSSITLILLGTSSLPCLFHPPSRVLGTSSPTCSFLLPSSMLRNCSLSKIASSPSTCVKRNV